ncbi:MAG: hypothetical protein AAF823_09380 [Planctomycetota bacterium]
MPPIIDDHGRHGQAATRAKRSWLRIAFRATGIVVAMTLAAAIYVVVQVRAVPEHYQRHLAFIEATAADERRALAAEALAKFDAAVALASGGRFGTANSLDPHGQLGDRKRNTDTTNPLDTDTVYTIEMSPEELNALLTEELDHFLAQTGEALPDGVSYPMLAHDDQRRFVVTFTAQIDEVSQVVSAWFDLQFTTQGDARVRVTRFDAGRMPVPAGRIGEAIAERTTRDEVQRVGQFLADLENYTFNPVLATTDGHRLRVIDFRVVEAGFAFDVRVIDASETKPRIAKAKKRN